MTTISDIVIPDIRLQLEAIQGYMGPQLATYTTQIPAAQIREVLGHDPRSRFWNNAPQATREIYRTIQRIDTKDRRNAISQYVEYRYKIGMVYAFPAISLGLTAKPDFEPFTNGNKYYYRSLGVIRLANEGSRIVLDGLGRVAGVLDLLDADDKELAELAKTIVFSVTFYCPVDPKNLLTVAQLGQLFSDFNFRIRKIPVSQTIALDNSDPYINLTNMLAREPFIDEHGKMEYRAASRGGKSTALVVQQQLLRCVRGACEGRDFQMSNLAHRTFPTLTTETFSSELRSIAEFFTAIVARMGKDRWSGDPDSIHLSSAGWQALGVIHHDMRHRGLGLSAAEESHIYDEIASVDWRRDNPLWSNQVRLGEWVIDKKGQKVFSLRGAGRTLTQDLLDYLRAKTGLDKKLAEHKEDRN